MDKPLLTSLQRLAYQSLKDGQNWQAILSQIYLDIEIMNETVYQDVVSQGATLSRVALGTPYATTYGDQKFDAHFVVQASRTSLINSLPEDMRERVSSRFASIDYLRDVQVPDTSQIAKATKHFREGEEAPNYRLLKQNYAALYDRSAQKALRSGKIAKSDVLTLALLSDQAAFDAHLIGISMEHRDWLLNAVMVRKSLYRSLIQPNFEAEDIYGEILNRRADLMATISHLQERDRQVKWNFDVELVANTRSVQEETAAA